MTEDLRLNDPVIITTSEEELHGTVAHLGPVQFAPGSNWVGIKLTSEYEGRGKNDGSVKGVFYFDAGGENNGVFVRRSNVRKLTDGGIRKSGLKTPSPRMSLARSASNSSDKSDKAAFFSKSPATNAAAVSRENFLRRLEQQQEKAKEKIASTSDQDKIEVAAVGGELKDTSVEKDMKKAEKTTVHPLQSNMNAESKEAATPVVASPSTSKETTTQILSNLPRGNQNEEMGTVMSFLSNQSNLTSDQSSLDWLKDVDASSLVFLKGLASGNSAISGHVDDTPAQNPDHSAMDWVKDVDTSSMDYLKKLASGNITPPTADTSEGDSKKETEDVLQKIVQATRSPQSLVTPPEPTNNTATSESTTAPPEKLSSLELRMLDMIENQNNQIQKMQAQLDAMHNMMSQMGGDVRYLRESQQRRDQSDGMMGLIDASRGLSFQRPPETIMSRRFPPPPPPLPPGAVVSPNQPNQNQDQPNVAGQPPIQPFQRGLFFPLFNFLFQSVVSFITNFRSLLQSTAPGRLYNHLRNEAIQRRAFANVEWRGLIKLVVMLAVFSGRLERGGNGDRNRRGNARRAQQNNNDEEGMAAFLAEYIGIAMSFLRAHRVHALSIAAFIGFLVSSGLMTFFYDVLWVEREELMNVWLGRNNEPDGATENNEAEDEHQQNANDGQPAAGDANQGVGAQVRAGPQNVRNNRQVNADHPRGGMIHRGGNGGFFHDIYCLIFSFILSLIPAWKPEEAAPPPDAQPVQQDGLDQQQQNANDAAEGDD